MTPTRDGASSAFPRRIGRISLGTASEVAKSCANYANECGSVMVAVDQHNVCWLTWPHNRAAARILLHMPESVIGTWPANCKAELIEWELLHRLQPARIAA